MGQKQSIFGYVQAGGGSRRFGSDKALSVLGGKTLLARTTELVASVCVNAKIIAAEGKYANAPVPMVPDRWPGQGPLGGILSAMAETAAAAAAVKWNLILGCDMPFLTRGWLDFLCARALASDAQVVVAQSAHGLEPLCACWKEDARTILQAAFDSGVRKVTEAMKRVPMEVLDDSTWKIFDTNGRLFWNMNTPEDFAEAQRIIETPTR